LHDINTVFVRQLCGSAETSGYIPSPPSTLNPGATVSSPRSSIAELHVIITSSTGLVLQADVAKSEDKNFLALSQAMLPSPSIARLPPPHTLPSSLRRRLLRKRRWPQQFLP
jgi:hypothetical protein